MSKSWKRFLSLLLALTMILSLGVTGFAEDTAEDETPIMEPGTPAEEPAPDDGNLEIIDISPDKLNIPKLGLEETEDEELPDGEELTPMEEDLDEVVRVSIFLETPSAMEAGYAAETAGTNAGAIAYRDGLRAQQAELTAQIESVIGHELNVHWNITLALNAISADLSLAEIVKVQALPGVKAVERENQYLPMDDETAEPNTANTSENMVGATAAWAAGYTGAGSRIAIIDTGIDPTHQSFAAEPFEYAIQQAGAANDLMTQADINRVLSQLNAKESMSSVTAAQLNQNGSKIVYGFNYVDHSLTIDHVHDTEGEHGSHVAGIAAANRFIGSAHDDAASTVGAVGMAPDAQLLIMKVFGANGGAYDSDYMVAIEDAMILGCDVANLSLGSGVQGWTFSNSYQGLVNGWANAGHNAKMVLSISAGNAYDLAYMTQQRNLYAEDVSMHTGGSPGSFVNSLCVAAAQNTIIKGTPMEFNGSQDVYYYESTGNEEEGTTYTNPALTTIVGTYNYVYIDAVGSAADYSAINSAVGLSGKVVLVNRGELSFVEKGENVKSYSPKALIIANNQPGTIYMDLTDFTGTFPMVTITQKDAEQIKAGAASHTASGITYYTGSMKVTNTEKEVLIDRSAATITDFSSWGVPGSLLMKPEITAPGGDIYSVAGTNNTSSGTAGGADQYEYMSGTSMAAPHITGLTAVLAEYQRENDLAALCPDLAGYSLRAIAQSLMMSTATPMAPGGEYLPILQQGAGLADVSKAVTANSVILMDPANSGLTGKTGAAADGKVKVELGDDPLRKGDYSFGFTVYNLSDDNLHFNVRTDMFTQGVALDADGELIMTRETVGLDATGTCWWEDLDGNVPAEGHDVNKDGVTDERDAQAILDYLSGEIEDESELDLEAGEMDGDDFLSTQDAYLLLGFEPAEGEGLGSGVVPAHGKRYCAVRITLSDADKEDLDLYYAGGAYLQGFTYVTCDSTTEEGAVYADEHSIPILGFYGSWTDATMFDTAPYTEKLYGSKQENYTGNAATNYLTLQMNGANVKFSGNPYMVENEFPADRLAINSNTTIGNIAYNLIRAAGTTGFAVSKLDADHQITDVLSAAVTGNEVTGMWYSQSNGWQGLTQKLYSVNKAPSAYGLGEGDLFRVGFYAIPEYNAMLVNDSYNAADSGMLDQKGFETLLKSNVLGTGAFVGFDFLVDNTAPVVESASLNGSEITVTASDDQALAYVAILSLDGETVYSEFAPGEAEYTTTIDASDAIANANGYVAVFAGDYAGNEAAVAVKVNDNGYAPMTVYVLTDTLTAGEEYLIVSGNTAGTRYALNYSLNTSGTTATVGRNAVTVKAGTDKTNNKVYIEDTDVSSTAVWTVGVGSSNTYRTFSNNDWYLRSSNSNNLTITKDTSRRDWTWSGSNNRLSNNSRYLRYYNNTFSLNTAANSVYLYQKTTILSDQPIDPYTVTNVTVTPATLDLYKGNTADVTAKVLPLTASDRTVTWSSSNNAIATVDEFGRVTAVAAGTAAIRATSNADSSKYGECTVTVNSFNKALNGIVWDEEGNVFFSSFNSNSLPAWSPLHSNPVGTYLTNAFMFDASTLYASTCDLSDTSVLYTVNRSTYALTEFGNNYVPAFGLARGMTGFSATYGLDFMVYGFAKYLIMGNVTPDHEDPDDSSSALYSGLPYALLDLSTTAVGDAYVCAVCARTISGQSASYYFLDETGKIWQTTASYSSSSGFSFSSPTLVVDTGIGTGLQYQSLYYDGTRIYWTHTTDEDCQLIIYVPSTGKLYNAGNFGEGVWPVAGVYVDGKAAPNAVGDEPMDDAVVGEPMLLQPVATRDALLTEDVIARLSAEGFSFGWALDEELEDEEIPEEEDLFEEPAEEPIEEPIEEPAPAEEGEASVFLGGLNAVRQILRLPVTLVSDLGAAGESEEDREAKTLVIDLSETEDSHNGLIAVDYDPELLTLVSAKSTDAASHISIHKDTEKGVVTIAYANKSDGSGDDTLPINSRAAFDPADDIEAGTVIVTLVFETSCVPAEVNLTTLERNDELELNEQETIEAEGANHAWGEPTWTWAGDYSSATASFVCANDETHTKTLTAAVTSKTTEASCEEAGKTVYTATVELDGETYTDTKEVAIEAIGHAWGEPTWTWAEDYSSATASFVCANDETHTRTLTAAVTSETTEASCEEAGKTVYTATVELDGETYTDTKEVAIEAIGHAWGEPTWTWAEDYSSATASFVCANDETHTRTLTAAVTSETTEASCEEAGKTVYTATVELDGETYTDTKEVAIEAIGHPWGEPTWTWAEDYSSATATFVCENDASHTKTVNATITSETNGRETVYTATVELDGLTYIDTKTVVSAAVTVTFDAGEGTVEPTTLEVNSGEAIGELPVPTREGGWKFIGWFTAPAESYLTAGQGTQVTAETTVDEDTTVYAHWRLPGDINGDGKVNNKDVTRLQKYLKGEAVEVVAFNLDTNGDGNVSNKDLTRLQRFVKGETVELN